MHPATVPSRLWAPRSGENGFIHDGIAQKIGELRPDPPEAGLKDEVDFKNSRGLCWHVVFSPDESYFAWIAGPRKVVLVPWNREKNQLASAQFHNARTGPQTSSHPPTSSASSSSTSYENLNNKIDDSPQLPACINIECCYPVQSLAFGSGIPNKNLLYQVPTADDDENEFNNSIINKWEPVDPVESNNNDDDEAITNKERKRQKKSHWTRFNFANNIILATGHTNGRICIWDVKTGKLLLELMDHKSAVRDLAFAPDGSLRLISASLDKTLKGWDLKEDGNMFNTFNVHRDAVIWCCWSPNSKLMASCGSDKAVHIWNMDSNKLFQSLSGHVHEVVSCSFSPDGALLATASWDSQVILWDPYLGKMMYKLYHLHPPPKLIYAAGANSAWVRCVSFANNGLNLVTISDDHLIRFWNLIGDVDPEGIALEDEQSLSCVYSPSGSCVAVGTAQYKINFYKTPNEVPKLLHLARMAVRINCTTKDVDTLEIPNFLNQYLKYEVWDA